MFRGQWCLSPLQGRHLVTSHSSPSLPSTVLNTLESPLAASSYFLESHQRSEISSLSKMISVLRKARSHRVPNLGCGGTESPGWFDVSPETSAGDVMHEWACCRNEAANQSPVSHSCGLLNHPNSFHGGIFKLKPKFDADSLLYSLSHFECHSHTVHVLTQWSLPAPPTSTVKSSVFTRVHCRPLSLAANLHWCHANHSRYINNIVNSCILWSILYINNILILLI